MELDLTESNGTGSYRIHPESLGNIDYISESIRTKIVEGKYVNLASLLIPEYRLLNESKSIKDTRLQKNFTVKEFIVAFHKYKSIHCSRFPWFLAEMDQYEVI